jgi:hypothetical protein
MRASAAEALTDGRGAGGTATRIVDSAGAAGLISGVEEAAFWHGRDSRRGLQAQSGRDTAACVREAEA